MDGGDVVPAGKKDFASKGGHTKKKKKKTVPANEIRAKSVTPSDHAKRAIKKGMLGKAVNRGGGGAVGETAVQKKTQNLCVSRITSPQGGRKRGGETPRCLDNPSVTLMLGRKSSRSPKKHVPARGEGAPNPHASLGKKKKNYAREEVDGENGGSTSARGEGKGGERSGRPSPFPFPVGGKIRARMFTKEGKKQKGKRSCNLPASGVSIQLKMDS